MRNLPPFLFRFKFYHKAPRRLIKHIEKRSTGTLLWERAKIAKLALLHEHEEKEAELGVKLESSRVEHISEIGQRPIKIGVQCAMALQIQRAYGLTVHVLARSDGQALRVWVVNVGGTSARMLHMAAGDSEIVDRIVLPPAAGLRKWLRMWSACVVAVPYAGGRACVTFEIV